MLPLCAERDANGCVMHPSCQRTRDAYRRCVQDDTPLDAGFTPSCWRPWKHMPPLCADAARSQRSALQIRTAEDLLVAYGPRLQVCGGSAYAMGT